MPSTGPDAASARFTDTLLELGFSQYESRCYVGLLSPGPQTGYAVSKATGVPQPKVYEALRKLVSRGAARQLPGEPVRFAAVPPQRLLKDLESSFDRRLDAAREASEKLDVGPEPPMQEPVARLGGHDDVVAAAAGALAAATRRVYLSATSAELEKLREPVTAAAERGVDVVILHFGKAPFPARGLRMFRHASTDGAVYRHHQSRHIALVADSKETIFGLAADGRVWSGIRTGSEPIIAAVKGYIRHDIDMQQVFDDFGAELTKAYGPGLHRLESYRAERGQAAADGELVAAEEERDSAQTG
jgi:sugar-specific transcriptional regulator TrmB